MAQIAIIGSGPAGIFTALTLLDQGVRDLILLERGSDLEQRHCPAREKNQACSHCDRCSILTGWGGAGAFSDGKLTLNTAVGGFLGELVPEEELQGLIRNVDQRFLGYGAPHRVHGRSNPKIRELGVRAKKAGMELVEMPVRHLGTENCYRILQRIREELEGKVEIRTGVPVGHIIAEGGVVQGVETQDGEWIPARFVVSAPGRSGSDWMRDEARRLGLAAVPSPVDIGLRVELPAAVLEEITGAVYEAKLIYYSRTFDDRVRTFCMNPHGEVVTEYMDGLVTVNGHSYARKRTENTNFAILVSTIFTEPFDDPIGYGRYISRLANLLGQGVLVQRLGDLLKGRRSTPARIARSTVYPTLRGATPGDLSFVLPYRYVQDIIEMLQAMDRLAPGVCSGHTLLYGVEVKFYSHRIEVDRNLESKIRNLFVVGDGAGITRGLIQASVSGILAGQEISRRIRSRSGGRKAAPKGRTANPSLTRPGRF